jgi:SPP1 family predicted phage head-tail adaptor
LDDEELRITNQLSTLNSQFSTEMISAGLLNKVITIEHLHIQRDDYGSDVEKWIPIITVKCNVKGFDSKSLLSSGKEIFTQYNLVFTIRKKGVPIFDLYNHYRIMYEGKIFQILNINMEDRDNIIILGELLNT